jgi:type VI secretion system protein ImpM
MRCGLYGKLPSKRDFIALSAPREFLNVWEKWLQGGISASRTRLGEAWQEAFLRAPIWRFWLGAELCGATIVGAFMPSVDGVGRYFPLTVFARPEDGGAIPPPELDPQDAWYTAAEDFLLSALGPDTSYEALAEALTTVGAVSEAPSTQRFPGLTRLPEGTLVTPADVEALPSLLAALRVHDHARSYASATFWWTIGGEGYRPLAIVGRRMPDPYVFTGMLTGRFDTVFE